MSGRSKGIGMSNTNGTKVGDLTHSNLAREVEYLPGSTEMFVKMLAAFVADPTDITGLKVDNLRFMAQSLRMEYQAIDSLLAVYDKFEKREPEVEE
jgi:hypothetical protein